MADRVIPSYGGKLPTLDALKAHVGEGYGSNQIADRYGVTREYTRQRLKEFGLTPPHDRQPRPSETPTVTMKLFSPTGPITLPRVSMLSHMGKYA